MSFPSFGIRSSLFLVAVSLVGILLTGIVLARPDSPASSPSASRLARPGATAGLPLDFILLHTSELSNPRNLPRGAPTDTVYLLGGPGTLAGKFEDALFVLSHLVQDCPSNAMARVALGLDEPAPAEAAAEGSDG